ncbi:MAG: hypothetical protein AAB582_01965 [Patescibacteria group bacterium]
MSKINFSNSASLANEFAVKLLSGTLNLSVDYDDEGLPLVEQTHTTPVFTTERIPAIRAALLRRRLSSLEIGDSETNSESHWSESERRGVLVYATDFDRGGKEHLAATFEVTRDYCDGERGEGWTRWRVAKVRILAFKTAIDLVLVYLGDNREPIWGTRVNP